MGFQLLLALCQHEGGDEVSCKLIIGGLVTAIVAMAGFIVKQFADRISDLKEVRDLSGTLQNTVERARGRGDTR